MARRGFPARAALLSWTPSHDPDHRSTVTQDYESFEEALQKLELDEEELNRLISAGEIRAFREGSQVKLRAQDVEKVAHQLGIGEEVGEESASEVLEVEELPLEDEGMVTTQLSEEDTLLDEVETVEVEDEPAPAPAAASRSGARRSGGRAAQEPEEPKETTGMLAAMIVTTVILVFAIPFAIGMVEGRKTGLTAGVADMFAPAE